MWRARSFACCARGLCFVLGLLIVVLFAEILECFEAMVVGSQLVVDAAVGWLVAASPVDEEFASVA